MPGGVTAGRLSDAGSPDGFFDSSLQDGLVEVVPPYEAGPRINGPFRSGKTQDQPQSFAAFGYFRANASGRGTPAELFLGSASQSCLICSRCRSRRL